MSASVRWRRRDGFTLIELLVVILIIGVLVAVAAPSFLGQTQKAHDSAAKQYLSVAYRAATAVATDREGDYTASGFDVSALAAAIQASEPELTVVAGDCPTDATTDQRHIVVDQTFTTGANLELCNDPDHTVWTLKVVNHQLQPFQATVVDGAGAPLVVAPANQAPPTVSGSAQVGQTLTASTGTWSGSPAGYSYTWQRADDAGFSQGLTVVASDSPSYTVQSSDLDDYLRVSVQATNSAGQASATSSAAGPVLPLAPFNQTPPLVTDSDQPGGATSHVQVGDHLSTDDGQWTDSPTGFSYTWQRSADAGFSSYTVVGSDSASYTISSADLDGYLRVAVQATNAGGSGSAFSSNQTGAVLPASPVNDPNTPPSFSGTVQANHQLTADPGAWSGSPTGYSYTWRTSANGTDGWSDVGSDSSTYTVEDTDVGRYVEVCVQATNAGGSGSACSDPSSQAATPDVPTATTAPALTDSDHGLASPQVGDHLVVDNGQWSNNPTSYHYTWQRSADAGFSSYSVVGADSASYTLTSADLGDYLRVAVQATNSGGSGSAFSNASGAVLAPPASNGTPPAPTQSGAAGASGTMTATPGSWTGSTPLSYSYSWQVCDSSGANCATDAARGTSASISLATADTGKTFRVVVTASNSAGFASATSATSAPATSSYYNTVRSDSPADYWRLDALQAFFEPWSGYSYGATPPWYAALGNWQVQNYANDPTLQTSTSGNDGTYGDGYAIFQVAVPTAHTITAQLINNNGSDSPNPGLMVDFVDGCNFDAIYFATSSHQLLYYVNRGCSPAAGVLTTNGNISTGNWLHVSAATDGQGGVIVTLNGIVIYRVAAGGGWLTNATHVGMFARASTTGLAGWIDNVHAFGGFSDNVGSKPGVMLQNLAYTGADTNVSGATADGNAAVDFQVAGDSVATNSKPAVPSAFTYEAWVKRSSAPSGAAAMIAGIYGGWEIVTDTSCHAETAYFGTDAGWHYTIGTSSLCDGNWHLVDGSWDGSTIKVYVDGVLQSSTASATGVANQTSVPLLNGYIHFGHQNDGTTNNPGAFIDDVSYYTSALSLAQIQRHYAAR